MSGQISMGLLLQNTFWAGIAALGFAILFNVPPRTLVLCALNGAVAYASRAWLTQAGLVGIETATLVAATLVGFLGIIFGQRQHAPALLFVVPGVIPLVPGALAFRTMINILILTTGDVEVNDALLIDAVVNLIKTTLIVIAMAGGVAVPTLILRRHRPMM
jgi:uncharacterized membrane protein YjjB (DUF3815 family)